MENKSCIVCPIYLKERDYNYALEFYQSKIEYKIGTPIYFVFSNQNHLDVFRARFFHKFGFDYNDYVLVPEEYGQYKCQVTTKKFYAVKYLQEKYKYIAVVDCECLFIRNCNMDVVLEEIWNSKTVLNANKSYLLRSLLKYCVDGLDLDNKKRIKKETGNYTYNCWFNDIPVYDTGYTKEFFDWIYKQDYKKILDDRYMVDYYVFLLYLMDNHNIKLNKIDLWAPVGIMEQIYYTHENNSFDIMKRMKTHWSSSENKITDNTVMLFHRDHRPTKKEMKDLLRFSKLRYIFGIIVCENKLLVTLFNKASRLLFYTKYYLKFRW